MRTDSMKIWESKQKGIFASIHKLHTKALNKKTGDMVGLYIEPLDFSPSDAIKLKMDHLHCGDCPLKPSTITYIDGVPITGPCYVATHWLSALWSSVKEKIVSRLPVGIFKKPLRLGVHGEPSMVPLSILKNLVKKAPKHTGYTHQWHKENKRKYAELLMASCDNLMAEQWHMTPLQLKRQANILGFRTFRVINKGQEIDKDEILCPNTSHGVQCADCGLCNGSGKAKNIYIEIHGPQNKVKSYQKST
jgi:hypothetical protein